MKRISSFFILVFLLVSCNSAVKTNEFDSLLNLVEKLDITRSEYTLGKELNPDQRERASGNLVENASPGTYKFKDKQLFVVADKNSNRVLIIYEQYETASQDKIREILGSLIIDFGEPTVMAHDKIIYWAYGENNKLTEQEYYEAKNGNDRLDILATIKLSSSESIMGATEDSNAGSIYYIISSEPVLRQLQKTHGK